MTLSVVVMCGNQRNAPTGADKRNRQEIVNCLFSFLSFSFLLSTYKDVFNFQAPQFQHSRCCSTIVRLMEWRMEQMFIPNDG